MTTDRSISYRNGASITQREWSGQWTRDTLLTEYDTAGCRLDIQVAESSDNPAITNSLTRFDFLGRAVSTVMPLGITSNLYDGVSIRILTSTRSGRPPVYNLYDDLGEQVGTIVSGITNRTDASYETISGEVWRVTESLAGAVRTVTRERLTGLSDTLRRHVVAVGADGVTNEAAATWDDTAQTLVETQTSSLRATSSIRETKYGRTIAETSVDGDRNFFFDPYGRVFYTERRPSGSAVWLSETWLGFNEHGDVEESDTFTGSGDTYAATFHAFDAFGREAVRIDSPGNAVTNAYDALGRPIAISGATYPIRRGYDTLGRMKMLGTTRDDSSFDETRWIFDHATGLVTNKLYADDSVVAYAYTPDGKPLRTTWARGPWKEQDYNADGLLTATTYSDATPSISFVYDSLQRLAAASNAVAAYVYAKSALGTATNETSMVGGVVCTLTRELDDRHRLASLRVGDAQAHFGYDAENRLATVSNAVFSVAYAYTTDGWDAGYAVTLTNGVVLSRALSRDTYRRGLITTITNSVDDIAVNPLAYNYDVLNRATARNADTFGYNARGEVSSASILSNAYAYAYDQIGNHTTSSVDSVATTCAANALNQYTSILCAPAPLREQSYDLDGSMLTNGIWSYTWDCENRLVAAYSNSLCVVSNAYDYMGRRVLKVSHGGTKTRSFVYDGWNLIQETIQNPQFTITNHYVWGKDLSGTMQGAGGVGGLLAISLNDSWYFPLTDANGNITAYIDEQGSVVAEYTYDAFGATIAKSGSMSEAFAHRFSTKYYDAETGLYYYGYRFYSPDLHRWMNRDPIEECGGLNLYAICENNVMQRLDYLGLDLVDLLFIAQQQAYKVIRQKWGTMKWIHAFGILNNLTARSLVNNAATIGTRMNERIRECQHPVEVVEVIDCVTPGSHTSETTSYPSGTSDFSVHVDRRGLRTVSTEYNFIDRSESVTQTFHPTNTIVPVTVSTNTMFRNGHSIFERHWDGQWIQEIQSSRYLESGCLEQISVTVSPDYGTVTNHVSLVDFLGRSVSVVTPLGTTTNLYDGASSRLVSSTRFTPSTSSTLTYLYDDLGSQMGQTQNGMTSCSDIAYGFVSNEWWRVSSQWAFCDGITNSVSTTREQLTGLSNALRRRSISTQPDGVTTHVRVSFDPATKILTETVESDVHSTIVRKRKFGRLTEVMTSSGNHYNCFDSCGRVFLTRRSLPGSATRLTGTFTDYDDAGDISGTGVYKGATQDWIDTEYAYDAFGRRTDTTDPIGGIETSSYDDAGRLTASAGTVYPVLYGYDTVGRMKELRTTRNGSTFDVTSWTFDPATGLAIAKTYADDSTIAYAYTDDGKPHRTTWARGEWKESAYDPQRRLAGVSYSDATPSASFGYDAFSRLSSASNAVASYAYAFSLLGITTNETVSISGDEHVLARELDAWQRLHALAVDGEGLAIYSYDADNRISAVSNASFVAEYHYTPDGYDAGYSVMLTNGIVLNRVVSRDFWRRNLIALVSNDVDSVALSTYQYGYDELSRATARNADTFGYNPRSEVTNATLNAIGYTYAYDDIGNHTTSSVNSVSTIYEATSLNQYSQISVPSVPSVDNPAYDLDGNTLTNGVWSYTWDCENRLTTVYSNSVCAVSNAYDYMSRRVTKWTPSHTTTYVYDGWNLVMEIQSSIIPPFQSSTKLYVLGKDLSGTIQGAGGVGGLLAVSLDGQYYLPCHDANGNITAYVDESGSVVAEYAYDAFGATIAQSGSMADTFNHRFSTKYYDSDTGLYYYGYRFYDPVLHRWLNRDPIEEEGGLNLYGFCGNDGVNAVDALGRTRFSVGLFWRRLTNSEWLEVQQLQNSIAEQCDTLIANIDQFFANHFTQAIPRAP